MDHSKRNEIQSFLKQKATEEGKAAFQKFVPTSQKVYGVRLPEINHLANQYKKEGIELAIALWEAGSFEERLLAAKLLGKGAKTQPQKTLQCIQQFSSDITDWAVCDTLGTQSIKTMAKEHHQEIFALSKKLLVSSNPWQRRLGMVLLEGYTKDKQHHSQIHSHLEIVKDDKEYYVKKAVEWIKRNLQKSCSYAQ
jgi:3-methyladenine DNA glycosylase AlkD